MGTQLIFTVGTNPLPVWVAWHHLKDQLEQPVKVRLIHTPGTEDEKGRLVKYCSDANFLDPISTSPGNPKKVHDDVQVVINTLEEFTHLHVHYTGGTKVMSVETVAALEYGLLELKGIEYHTTYLDPRGGEGPTIVDSHGKTYEPSDARNNINPDLRHIANLNGFTLAPFVHEYWDKNRGDYRRENIPKPVILNEDQEQQGNEVLDGMASTNPDYIDSTRFEYAAYVALKDALTKIEDRNATRNNYKLFNKVHVRRTGAAQRDAHFELDVVAILGYQIVVVSCSLETGSDSIKEKGMEVILRARQLGGDEAQAIVLCQAHPNVEKRIQKELHDEVGSAGAPLRVWGTDKWRNLSDHFYNYLRDDLYWQ